jgi:hypothetical protein
MRCSARFASGPRLHQAILVSEDPRLDSVTETELAEHLANVRLRRPAADDELAGYLLVRKAPRKQRQHLSLTSGEVL